MGLLLQHLITGVQSLLDAQRLFATKDRDDINTLADVFVDQVIAIAVVLALTHHLPARRCLANFQFMSLCFPLRFVMH